MARVKVAFYADDATGAADSMAQLTHAGLRTVLITNLKNVKSMEALADTYDAIGIVGIARALPPEQIAYDVRPALRALAALRPEIVQYKICSTFDSSPDRGNIVAGIELLQEQYPGQPVIVAPAQPQFGRYTAFGTHFAQQGGAIYRLDRHPTMTAHPSTPMHEADLRLVLQDQDIKHLHRIGVVMLPALADGANALADAHRTSAEDIIVVDATTDHHLDAVTDFGIALSSIGSSPPIFVGSGGISAAIGRRLSDTNHEVNTTPTVAAANQMLAVAGSASQGTAQQVKHAVAHGWAAVPVALNLIREDPAGALSMVQQVASDLLADGRNVVVHTILTEPVADSHLLSLTTGNIFSQVVAQAFRDRHIQRALVAGGDTSSYFVHAFPAYTMELVSTGFAVAGPLCRLRSTEPVLDGVEILFKGGQVGTADLFERVRQGAYTQVAGAPAS